MTTLVWNGGDHRFFFRGAWTPSNVPTPGDTVFIGAGTAEVHGGTLSGLTVRLDAPYLGETPQTISGPGGVLRLEQATIASDTTVSLGGIVAGGSTSATIEAAGRNVNSGTITNGAISSVGPPDGPPTSLTIHVAGRHGGLLVNAGTLSVTPETFAPSTMTVHGEPGSALKNDGLISSQGTIKLDIDVIGYGRMAFGQVFEATHDGPPEGATIEIDQAAGWGQTVDFGTGVQGIFNTGTDSHGSLILGDPAEFHSVIADFVASSLPNFGALHPDEVVLPNTNVTSLAYCGSACGGVLTLYGGSAAEAHLRFAGSYSAGEFQISHPTATGSVIELKPIV